MTHNTLRENNSSLYWKIKYKERDRGKLRARWVTKGLVKRGTIKKNPCQECGSIKVEAHHLDYNKPLGVIWLCIKHHRIIHKKFRLCMMNKCKRPHQAKGLCSMHYVKSWRKSHNLFKRPRSFP